MKKLVLLTSMAFMAIIGHAQTAVDINKVLEFKNADYNMGQIQTGKASDYAVEIKNISKDTITLITAKPTCGCTTPNFIPNQKVAPGQSTKVNISFNGSATGPFTRTTDIIFDKGLVKQVKFSGEGVAQVPAPAPAGSPAPAKS